MSGISPDTIFTVFITISIFIGGYLVNKVVENMKEKRRLIELEKYFIKLIELLEVPVKRQCQSFLDFSKVLKEKREQHLLMTDVSNFVIDQIKEIDNKDLYSIYIKNKSGDTDIKTELYRKIRGNIAYIESIRQAFNKEFISFNDKFEKYQDEYIQNIKVTSEAYEQMRVYYEIHKKEIGQDKFLIELDEIRAKWTGLEKDGIDYRDRYIAREHYIDKIRQLCKDSIGDQRAVYILKHIMDCIYAFDNIEELKYFYRRHFLLYSRGLQKALIEIRTSLKGFNQR